MHIESFTLSAIMFKNRESSHFHCNCPYVHARLMWWSVLGGVCCRLSVMRNSCVECMYVCMYESEWLSVSSMMMRVMSQSVNGRTIVDKGISQ